MSANDWLSVLTIVILIATAISIGVALNLMNYLQKLKARHIDLLRFFISQITNHHKVLMDMEKIEGESVKGNALHAIMELARALEWYNKDKESSKTHYLKLLAIATEGDVLIERGIDDDIKEHGRVLNNIIIDIIKDLSAKDKAIIHDFRLKVRLCDIGNRIKYNPDCLINLPNRLDVNYF